jgi:methyl-accepting chemotaxis protein
MLRNRSITLQFSLIFLLALALVGGAFYLIMDHIYRSQLKSQAETVADNVEAFGTWVAQYGRVWVKDDNRSYLGHLALAKAPEPAVVDTQAKLLPVAIKADEELVHFFSKNPALAQREYSEVVEKSSSPAKFRMTSHNFMNPANTPDEFESKALDVVRTNRLKDYAEMSGGSYRYARTLYMKASCIACHGVADKAPLDVKVRYGTLRGFGFKEGDVGGIISVRLPTKSFWETSINVIGPWEIALLLGALVIAFLFIQFSVVAPVKQLTMAAEKISVGEHVNIELSAGTEQSSNEIDHLAMAIQRLGTSIHLATQQLRKLGTAKPTPPPS